jgi:hypothetical protein
VSVGGRVKIHLIRKLMRLTLSRDWSTKWDFFSYKRFQPFVTKGFRHSKNDKKELKNRLKDFFTTYKNISKK